MNKVLILGGYGNFGKRIVEGLSDLEGITLLIAGRNINKAEALKKRLAKNSQANLQAVFIDIEAPNFKNILESLSPDIAIHTSGPFQNQGLHVPQACLEAGIHYIDLGDDREFVCNISKLDPLAKQKDLLLVSGASSVPGLSSAVIDHYKDQFLVIDSIDIAIVPGNKAERGEATIRGILSYTGHPFKIFKDNQWKKAYGWMSPRQLDFGGNVGKRWLANVDVPDLELFPQHYSVKQSVTFQAGLELPILHWTMVSMAYLTKIGLIKNWSPLTKPIMNISNLFKPLGTDSGGMRITIKGKSKQSEHKTIYWTLYADNGIGPYIPTISTVIIAKKLLLGELSETGAKPCVGLYTLDDFIPYAVKHQLDYKEQSIG